MAIVYSIITEEQRLHLVNQESSCFGTRKVGHWKNPPYQPFQVILHSSVLSISRKRWPSRPRGDVGSAADRHMGVDLAARQSPTDRTSMPYIDDHQHVP